MAPLPASAGAAAQGQFKNGVDLVRHILARVASAVLEVWASPALPSAGPPVVAAIVSVSAANGRWLNPYKINRQGLLLCIIRNPWRKRDSCPFSTPS